MNKLFFSIMVCATSISIYCAEVTPPTFAEPIHLFKPRDLEAKRQKKCPGKTIDPIIAAWLQTPQAFAVIQAAAERQLKQIAHDEHRLEIYSIKPINPEAIVLTRSSNATLQETVQGLTQEGLAHNFIIDTNGNIHPVTREGETVEQALQHRPFALGESGFEFNGYRAQRDMNSAAITVSVVGKPTDPISTEQEQGMVKLVAFLSKRYNITADRVLDYGRVAYPYGRRNPSPCIMDLLAKHGLTIRPKREQVENTYIPFHNEYEKTIWTSQALREIGHVNCPITRNGALADFKAALQAFQKDVECQKQDGIISDETLRKLNSMLIQYKQHNPTLKDIEPEALPIISREIPWA